MPNQIIDTINKRSSELAEKSQKAISTAYQRSLDVFGLDEDEMRDRLDQLKNRGEQIEATVQKTINDQLKELQLAEVKVINRLEEAVGSFKDLVSTNYGRISTSLDRLEGRLKDVEKSLSNRIHQLPIEDYDRLNADEIVRQIDALGANGLSTLRDYEAGHKGRVTILKAIDARLAA
jgi:DNA anti-recombination protein RmuC